MRIAIIGSGISGLTAAYYLHQKHQVKLFEANDYIGGHTNTVDVDWEGEQHAIDTGFIVFNDRTYPNFIHLLSELNVVSQATKMNFSIKAEESGLEFRGADLNGLFAQRRNLLRPRYYRLLAEIVRFNRIAIQSRDLDNHDISVGEFLGRYKLSQDFIDYYFLPMGSAIWSCPCGTFEQFPIQFILDFYFNHGLLSLKNRPQWRVVSGGSNQYVKAFSKVIGHTFQTRTPISTIYRTPHYVDVYPKAGLSERFDHVIFACHSDQALKILGRNATPVERELLSAFPYEPNVVQLHTDSSVLPKSRNAWASWNYLVPKNRSNKATVTYNMNLLQGLQSKNSFCVTLNGQDQVDPARVIREFNYAHPVFSHNRIKAQSRHDEVINKCHTSFCGAYWGNGFHEDGVNSALAVCSAIEESSEKWKAASTMDGSVIKDMNPLNISSAIEST